jgi:hypothetical protein
MTKAIGFEDLNKINMLGVFWEGGNSFLNSNSAS